MSYAILSLLILAGLAFLLLPFLRRAPSVAQKLREDEELEELHSERDALYQAIRELELDYQTGKLSQEDYRALRRDYQAKAARLLKRLDALGASAGVTAQAPQRIAGQPAKPLVSGRLSTALWAVGILGVGIALGFLLHRSLFSGNPTRAMTPAAPRQGAMSLEMIRGMLAAAHQSLEQGRYSEAIAAYKAILDRDPRNVEAITHLGIVAGMAGHTDTALQAFDKALAVDPSYAHALWDKGLLLLQVKKDYRRAIEAFERFIALVPGSSDAEQAKGFIEEAKKKLKEGGG